LINTFNTLLGENKLVTLVSPGVDVEIIDESFYGGAGAGTVPLIVIATASNKPSPANDGTIAPYSAPSQAGKLFLATSQRELIQNFGTPTFKVVQGTPVHGYELNEFGLMTAYQFLGISNRAFILRANIDLAALESSSTPPVGAPPVGTYYLDLSKTTFGVFQSNGNAQAGKAWASQPVLYAAAGSVSTLNNTDVPAANFGTDGAFCVVVTQSDNLLYEKISGEWFQVGSTDWTAERPTTIVGRTNPGSILTTDTIVINSTTVAFDQIPDGQGGFTAGSGSVGETVTAINAAAIQNIVASVSGSGALVIQDLTGAAILVNNGNGTPLATYGITAGTTNGVGFVFTNNAQYPAGYAAGSVWIKGSQPNLGANWVVNVYTSASGFVQQIAPFYQFFPNQADGLASKDQFATAGFGTPVAGAIYVGYDPVTGTQQLRRFNGTSWANLVYEAGTIAPTVEPAAGTLYYNANFRADIMYGTGTAWEGYARKFPSSDPAGVLISGSAPLLQSDGTPLVDEDLWIDSSDLENYPMIYRYDTTQAKWILIDNTDQTSPFGIVFADARQDSGTSFSGNTSTGYAYMSEATTDMVLSNFVDPDAPDPRVYPDGMLLFNTRYSTYNVKAWNPTYFNAGGFDPNTNYAINTYTNGSGGAVFPALSNNVGRWVTASGNNVDGSPYMGRKAQRQMVVKALEAEVVSNDDIRSEMVFYNLLATPGYPELMTEMVSLNVDQKQFAFITGDTPIRMDPSGTSVTQWATNGLDVPATNEDGLTLGDDYTGVYYPWGLSTDLGGNEIMLPPSSMALCTLAYNDQVAYPWFAPAGFTRGLVTNASSVGYLTSEGEFKPVILNPGQRDTLYTNKINPIAYIPGRGLVVFGEKTLAPVATSLDRVNVARLTNYLKYNLDALVKPFLFEQNDAQTQASAQAVVAGFLNGLIGLRALSDYAVICDSTNNTASRVDANELWIDIAVKPIKAIEFIYVPVRILNTGTDITTALSATVSL
jgi:hypothetical protein